MHITPIAVYINCFLRRKVMNAILKTLIAAGIVASFSLNAMADDTASVNITIPQDTQPSANAGAATEQKPGAAQERLKTMTPDELVKEREAMRKEWGSLTQQQRDAKRKEMHEQLKRLTPEERRAMHQKMRENMMKMLPEERARQRDEMRKEWDSLTPQQRAERRKEMRERFEKMSPEERKQFKRDMDMRGMPHLYSDPADNKPADTKTPAGNPAGK